MTKHFKYNEFIQSPTATRLCIDNSPSPQIVEHLRHLASALLEPIRENYGAPVRITSAFRSMSLNKAVGGSPLSQHMQGMAADIVIDPARLLTILYQKRLDFDQLIVYDSFVHISLNPEGWKNRRQILIEAKLLKKRG